MTYSNTIHPNLKLLSHSAENLLTSCPRLYELDRLSVKADYGVNVDMNFGTVVGIGVQEYFVSGDKNKSIMAMFLAWPEDIFAFSDRAVKSKKTFFWAIHALNRFMPVRDGPLREYDVLQIDDAPSVELGFRILFPDDFSYRGKLDILVQSRVTGKLAVVECKTTKYSIINPEVYRNSSQASAYIIVADSVAARLEIPAQEALAIYYTVYSSSSLDWEILHFNKSRVELTNWIRTELYNMAHITEFAAKNFFPKNGNSCFAYSRPCGWFELCDLSNNNIIGDIANIPEKIDKEEDYPFIFSINDIIRDQLEK